MLPLILILSLGGAAKHSGLDSALPVPSLCIAAPAGRNRSDLPWRSRVVPCLVRIKLRLPSRFFTEHMVPEDHPYIGRSYEVKEQLRVGDPLSV